MDRRERKVAVIEGARPVIEAIRAGRRAIHRVQMPVGRGSAALRELAELLEEKRIPLESAPSETVPLAHVDPFPEESFEDLVADSRVRYLVALDRVTDVGNLGSIARTAEASGVDGLVLEYRHAPPIAGGALRASAGALEHLRVGRTPNLRRALELACIEGFTVLVAEPGGCPIAELDRERIRGRILWVFGSEEHGTRAGIRSLAHGTVGIPLRGSVSSLGVAAAAAYLLVRTSEMRSAASRRTEGS